MILSLPWSQYGYEKLPNHGVVAVTGAHSERQRIEILQTHSHYLGYGSYYPSFVCLHEFFILSFTYQIYKAFGMWSGSVVGLGNSYLESALKKLAAWLKQMHKTRMQYGLYNDKDISWDIEEYRAGPFSTAWWCWLMRWGQWKQTYVCDICFKQLLISWTSWSPWGMIPYWRLRFST